MDLKRCSRCEEEKDVEFFTNDYRHTDKLQSRCTPCRSEDNKLRKLKYKLQGNCQLCGLANDRKDKACCSKCSARGSKNKQDIKIKVFEAYGGIICICCGESNLKFLTLDHINNDGALHRKSIYSNIYRWAIRNNFPKGFQVLCWNCNLGKYHNKGICPHKDKANI